MLSFFRYGGGGRSNGRGQNPPQQQMQMMEDDDDEYDRGHWGSKAEFILSCIGFSVRLFLQCLMF